MKKFHLYFALLSLSAFSIGCGGSAVETSAAPKSNSNKVVAQSAEPELQITGRAVPSVTPASEVVMMFLDSLKKGDSAIVRNLITDAAKQEIDRHGLTLAPIGTPAAKFKVGRTLFLDSDEDSAYVESEWVEAGEGDQLVKTDVVITVHLQEQGWKISGMAIEMGEDQPPAVIDFEQMDSGLAAELTNQNEDGTRTAAAPNTQSTLK